MVKSLLEKSTDPYLYLIQSDRGIYRRNRCHLSYIETETNVEIEHQDMREYLEQDREVDISKNPPDVNIIPPRFDNETYVTYSI